MDSVVLNTIEFWTGSNPLALKGEEKQKKIVKSDDKVYEIIMGNNEINIKEIEGPDKGQEILLSYDEELKSWFLHSNGGIIKIAKFDDNKTNIVKLFFPDGTVLENNLAN